MIICDHPRFIFIHVPKTAGTSISSLLAHANNPELCLASTKHETAASLISRIGLAAFDSYFSFAIVRHPVERLVSHFAYLKSHPEQYPEMVAVETLDRYVEAIDAGDMTILRKRERIMPQHAWVCSDDGSMLVDRVATYERLDADLAGIFRAIGLSVGPLPRLNVSTWRKPAPSAAVVDFIESYYSRDYELFGYPRRR
ncbi:MAG: hypothetical protein EBZ59_02885 [Planctomycetia bacterium]|nr:hypothetical protein [Planctomycetia bacterium]